MLMYCWLPMIARGNHYPAGCAGRVEEIVENGVDPNVWNCGEQNEPCESGRDEGNRKCEFLYVGRLVDWKAVDIAIEAFSQVVSEAMSDADMSMSVIGDGPQRAALQSFAVESAQKHGFATDRIRFLGWQTQPEIASRLRRCRALVLPSLYECGGAVVLEAMACGRPVIATHWGGPADYLDETTGILIEPTSRRAIVDGFRAAIDCLANDALLAEKMGKAAASRALSCYTWKSKADHVLQVYRDAKEVYRASQTTILETAGEIPASKER